MKTIKFIILIQLIFGLSSCDKEENVFNSMLIGNWQLIEIGGTDENNMIFWQVRVDTINTDIQTVQFNADGNYQISTNGNPSCNGRFTFETDTTIRMIPNDCMPLMESVEYIKKVTTDTLIITNKSISYSSYLGRVDKYYKIE